MYKGKLIDWNVSNDDNNDEITCFLNFMDQFWSIIERLLDGFVVPSKISGCGGGGGGG